MRRFIAALVLSVLLVVACGDPIETYRIVLGRTGLIVEQGSSGTVAVSLTISRAGIGGPAPFIVTGLPTGVSASFDPPQGEVQGMSTLTLAVAATVAVGSYPLTVATTSEFDDPAVLTLEVVASVPTSFTDAGRVLYLDSGVVRVGVDRDWGGAVREIWVGGLNLVNNYDGGRLLGVSFYDGDTPGGSAPTDTGWNPTPSDQYDAINLPLAYSFDDGTLYLRSRYLQWYPDDKGGGPGQPVATDVIVETWLRFFADWRARVIALG